MGKRGPKPGSPAAMRSSERMRKLHADPEFKAALRERTRKLNADPEFKAALRERMRKLHADPEFKAAIHPWLATLTAKERADYDVLRKAMPAAEARATIERQREIAARRSVTHDGDAA